MVNISPTSWSLIENSVCNKGFGGTLISLHSKLEQDFVGYVLLHKYKSTNNQYAYIGNEFKFYF